MVKCKRHNTCTCKQKIWRPALWLYYAQCHMSYLVSGPVYRHKNVADRTSRSGGAWRFSPSN